MFKSQTLTDFYHDWSETAEVPPLAFVDAVYDLCEKNFFAGGDEIVVGFTPQQILAKFVNLHQVRAYCLDKVEQRLFLRWGATFDFGAKSTAWLGVPRP